MSKNNWEKLGVPPGTSLEDLEKVYKKLVKEHHPDLNPGDDKSAERMSEINSAYTALKKGETGEAPTGHPGGFHFDAASIFEQMAARMMNANIQSVLQVPIRTLIDGGSVGFGYQRLIRMSNGMRAAQNITKMVKIVPNQPIRQPLVFKQEGGHDDPSRPAGDLILHIMPIGDDEYQIEDTTIHIEKKIDVFTAMLGGSIEAKVLSGKTMKVTVPAGTSSGVVFRLAAQGMQITTRDRGHLYVHINVEIPAIINDDLIVKINEIKKSIYDTTDETNTS